MTLKSLESIYFPNRKSFRVWLENNHDKNPGIWMIFYKKHTSVKCINYNEALEEALCFGWIDSLIKKVDDDQYLRKFTPRTNTKLWSDINKNLVVMLIENGSMTKAGLEKIDTYLKTGSVNWEMEKPKGIKEKKEFIIPDFVLIKFAENEPALTNFNKLTQSHKKNFVQWITSAKRETTINTRVEESIKMLIDNKRLGLK